VVTGLSSVPSGVRYAVTVTVVTGAGVEAGNAVCELLAEAGALVAWPLRLVAISSVGASASTPMFGLNLDH
jgi:NADP-dependent 3-hydroxy acid dehydrogenase YdfG